MRSRLGSVLVVGLAASLLSACGGGPEVLSQKTLFSRIAAAQAKEGSYHVTAVRTVDPGQEFRSYGDVSLGKKPDDNAMAMTVSGGGGSAAEKIETRLVDQNFYLKIGPMTKDKFIKIDLGDASNPALRQATEAIRSIDPASEFKQYKAGIEKFDSSGKPVKIDGVQTQPYKMTIDPAKAIKAEDRGAAKLPKSLTFTLFVGPDDLPRRVILQVPAVGSIGKSQQQTEFSKWGEKVSIAAPTALVDIKETPLAQLGGALGQ